MAEGGGTGAADVGPRASVTIIVDGANVVGSRPDGWWRDRAGAAVRLHDNLAKLADRGRRGIPGAELAVGQGPAVGRGPGHDLRAEPAPATQTAAVSLIPVTVLLVLEGAARAAVPRIAERGPGEVEVVSAPGSGDDEIVRQARHLAGHCIVVTADRELRRRCVAVGARVTGPSWLYGLL